MIKQALVVITILTGEQPVKQVQQYSTVEACEQQAENIRQAIDETLPEPYKVGTIECEANA